MSAPTVTQTRTYRVDIVTVNGDVADGPELRDIRDRPFVVDHIVACWKRQNHKTGAWWLEWVKVSGVRVLKSGTRSATRLEVHLDPVRVSARLDWVNTWLTANEPKGTD